MNKIFLLLSSLRGLILRHCEIVRNVQQSNPHFQRKKFLPKRDELASLHFVSFAMTGARKLFLFGLLGLISFASCTKNAGKVKLPKTEKLLVVQCIMSPYDGRTTVRVDWSQDYFNNPNQNPNSGIDNCKVTISINGQTYTLQNTGTGNYRIDSTAMKVIPGQTYSLYVKEPGGKEATAVCTVPLISKSSLNFVSMDSQTTKFAGQDEKSFFMKCRLDDDGATKDFYTIYPLAHYQYWNYVYDSTFQNAIDSNLLEGTNETYLELSEKYVEDVNFNGGKRNMSFSFQEPAGPWNPNNPNRLKSRYDTLELLTIQGDEAYFRYHRSLESFNQTQGDPFAEPTFIYSNINGGIGIFAAYIQKRVLVKL